MEGFRFGGRKVVLAGGDGRNEYLARRLDELEAEVWLVRLKSLAAGVAHHVRSLAEALRGASILVCPLAPFGAGGRIWSDDPGDSLTLLGPELLLMATPALVFGGSFPPELAQTASLAGCRLVPLGQLDEVAILNSVPTAEGAIMMALERTTVTVRGSRAVVLGHGRTGQTLAATLTALGAKVTVVARRAEARARALASGCENVMDFTDLGQAVAGARFIFNTVPAMVLDAAALSQAHPGAVVIDLASGEGGTDFAAAAGLGLTAVLAPALPGRVAPETAASYLADVIVRAAAEHFGPPTVPGVEPADGPDTAPVGVQLRMVGLPGKGVIA